MKLVELNPHVNQDVVRCLEGLLREANSGEFIAFAACLIRDADAVDTIIAGANRTTTHKVVAGAHYIIDRAMKHRDVQVISE